MHRAFYSSLFLLSKPVRIDALITLKMNRQLSTTSSPHHCFTTTKMPVCKSVLGKKNKNIQFFKRYQLTLFFQNFFNRKYESTRVFSSLLFSVNLVKYKYRTQLSRKYRGDNTEISTVIDANLCVELSLNQFFLRSYCDFEVNILCIF